MPQLLVIRHSRAVANEQGILMGAKLDSPLSDGGIELAKARGAELKQQGYKPDRVYTSELKRAIQTAQIILEELGLNLEIIRLAELNERDFGIYDGRPYSFVLDAFKQNGDNPPTVEPASEFEPRVMKALEQIKSESNGNTLVVTHSNPVLVMQKELHKIESSVAASAEGDPNYCQGFTYNF